MEWREKRGEAEGKAPSAQEFLSSALIQCQYPGAGGRRTERPDPGQHQLHCGTISLSTKQGLPAKYDSADEVLAANSVNLSSSLSSTRKDSL